MVNKVSIIGFITEKSEGVSIRRRIKEQLESKQVNNDSILDDKLPGLQRCQRESSLVCALAMRCVRTDRLGG